MALAGASFIHRNSAGAIYCDSVVTVSTSGTASISTDVPIGANVIEVVSDQPCYIGFNSERFIEADLLNLSPLLLLDARDLAGVYTDADPITSWADASGNGYDAEEATTPPVYDADGLDGIYPSAHFNGTTFLNSAITDAVAKAYTVMVVGRLDNAAGTASMLGFTAALSLDYDADNDKFDYTTGTTNATAEGVLQDAPFLLTASEAGIWQNGALLKSGLTLTDRALTAVAIGSNAANAANFVDGEISAVVVFAGELSDIDRQAAESYIAKSFGISLVAAHPYASTLSERGHVSSTSGIYLPANTVRRLVVNPNHYMAVIRTGSTDAKVNVAKALEV